MDAIIFAINEKANQASTLMNLYSNTDKEKFEFYRGQYLAFIEVYSLLNNSNN